VPWNASAPTAVHPSEVVCAMQPWNVIWPCGAAANVVSEFETSDAT
jgi:hypothetical protein